jgi:hypothetical protein
MEEVPILDTLTEREKAFMLSARVQKIRTLKLISSVTEDKDGKSR